MSVVRAVIDRILTVRSMAAEDLPRLLQLEKTPCGNRWIWHEWPIDLPTDKGGLWVASVQNLLVGYVAYQEVPESIEAAWGPIGRNASKAIKQQTAAPICHLSVMRLFVTPEWRRRGIGRALAAQFSPHLPQDSKYSVQAVVPETNLPMQLLLRSAGYKAVGIIRGYGSYEDRYLMQRMHSPITD